MFFNFIQNLPNEIKELIFNKINSKELIFLNKYYYFNFSKIIPLYIKNYSNYLRDLIRNDCIFVVKNVINYNFNYLIEKKNIRYKNFNFDNYLQLIYHFIKYYSAQKCLQFFNINLCSFKKEWLKNNPYKNNRWSF